MRLWNLRLSELDFESEPRDIRMSAPSGSEAPIYKSLREYMQVLYLRPRMHMVLRGAEINVIHFKLKGLKTGDLR